MSTRIKINIKMKQNPRQKCVRCQNMYNYPDDFVSPRTGKVIAVCAICTNKKYCHHDKIRTGCKQCGGSEICEHGIHKSYCKKCGGKSICIHNIDKRYCRICGGSKTCEHIIDRTMCKICNNPMLVIAKGMVRNSKRYDKKCNRDNDITVDHCLKLLDEIKQCIYCGIDFTYDDMKESSKVSLQRLDNDIGHTVNNCSLCCIDCNMIDGRLKNKNSENR